MSLAAQIMPHAPRWVVRTLARLLKASMRFGFPRRDALLWAELDRWLMAEQSGEGRS